MRAADDREEHRVGSRHLGEGLHVPEVGDAELDDGELVLRLNARERKRHAELVVIVSRRFEHVPPLREDGGDHLFRGRLADAAGDAEHGDREPTAEIRADGLERGLHVRHRDDGALLPFRHETRQRADGARVERRGDEAVAVALLAGHGGEEAAGDGDAVVLHDGGDCRAALARERAADEGGEIGNGIAEHGFSPFGARSR